MDARKYIAYGTIGLVSLAEGVYEGLSDAPGILKPILIGGIPVVSGFVGAGIEFKEDYDRTDGEMNEGFLHTMKTAEGFAKGGGLSVLCETAGFLITKGLQNAFS
jgi:hypothetical protein